MEDTNSTEETMYVFNNCSKVIKVELHNLFYECKSAYNHILVFCITHILKFEIIKSTKTITSQVWIEMFNPYCDYNEINFMYYSDKHQTTLKELNKAFDIIIGNYIVSLNCLGDIGISHLMNTKLYTTTKLYEFVLCDGTTVPFVLKTTDSCINYGSIEYTKTPMTAEMLAELTVDEHNSCLIKNGLDNDGDDSCIDDADKCC